MASRRGSVVAGSRRGSVVGLADVREACADGAESLSDRPSQPRRAAADVPSAEAAERADAAGGYQSRYMVQSVGPADRARLCLPIDVLSSTAPMEVEAMVPDNDTGDGGEARYRVSLAAATWPPPPASRHFLPRGASATARG